MSFRYKENATKPSYICTTAEEAEMFIRTLMKRNLTCTVWAISYIPTA